MTTLLFASSAYGQLITDSQARLKTVDKKSSFLSQQRKNRPKAGSSSTQPFHDYKSRSPKYSKDSPYGGVLSSVQPRYSRGAPFGGVLTSTTPRYSSGAPFGGVLTVKTPRYSPGDPFSGLSYRVKPRYSQGQPYGGVLTVTTPRYTSPGSPFDKNYKPSNLPKNSTASFNGPYSVSYPSMRNTHPSGRYTSDYRNLSLLWAKMIGNNTSPDGVKENVPKPKFDRKEREIWNN